MNQPLCFFLANNPDTVDKLEGLVALWSKVIEQVLAESEQVGHTPLWLMYSTLYLLLNFLLMYNVRKAIIGRICII